MQCVDTVDQRGDRSVALDRIGMAQGIGVGNAALAVTGLDVGVGLVDNPRVGLELARGFEQRQIGHAGAPGQDRTIVLDLPGHQHTSAGIARGQGHRHGAAIFADTFGYGPGPQCRRASQQFRRHVRFGKDRFEIARGAGVEIDAAPVDDHRQRRHAIGPEPDRADHAILDLARHDAERVECDEQRRRRARFPRDCGISGRKHRRLAGAGVPHRTGAVPQERIDRHALPPRHAEHRADRPVGVDQLAPIGQQRDRIAGRE